MTDWIKETQIVREIASQLLLPKPTQYHEDFLIYKMSKAKHLKHRNFKIVNEFKQLLNATLVSNKNQNNEVCVIFLHGYGSNKLEGLMLIESLPKDLDLCCFDFSASGKSQGNMTTFGIKQFKDIRAIIKKLRTQQFGYKKFILWGRSMGSVASLLFTASEEEADRIDSKDIIFQVLDSPFSSFQSICYHQGKQSLKLPQAFITLGIKILKDYFNDQQKSKNPFNIDLIKAGSRCQTSSLFVLSQTDSIIPPENTLSIIQKLPKSTYFQKLLISQNHNSLRKAETNQKIFLIIRKNYLKWLYSQKSTTTNKLDLSNPPNLNKQRTYLFLSNLLLKNFSKGGKKLQTQQNYSSSDEQKIYPTMNKKQLSTLIMFKKKQTSITQQTNLQTANERRAKKPRIKKRALYCSLRKNIPNPQCDIFQRRRSHYDIQQQQ